MSDQAMTSTEVSPAQVQEMLDSGEAQPVDVRLPYEFEAGHIAGATHIPLEALPAEAGGLDRDRPVVFICRTGSRSAMATAAFRESGFDAFNLAGGLVAWIEAGLPIEPPDGEAAGPSPDAS